jgi:hypothetical protein
MNREVWGPKIWFILHRLSFFSDRTDITGAWNKMLKDLHEILPCALCKDHMGKYCKEYPIHKAIVNGAKGEDIKKSVILWVYRFHNHVNVSKKAAKFEKEKLNMFYGYGTRQDLAMEINRTISELETIWINVPIKNWRTSVKHLLGLVSSGPYG